MLGFNSTTVMMLHLLALVVVVALAAPKTLGWPDWLGKLGEYRNSIFSRFLHFLKCTYT
jgi:hypothetical protein